LVVVIVPVLLQEHVLEMGCRVEATTGLNKETRQARRQSAMAEKTVPPPVPENLAKWRAEGSVKEIDGHQIFVHASGPVSDDGHGVLYVHGYPGSSWDFQAVTELIGDKARVVSIDMPGFGLSEKPMGGTYQQNYSLMAAADIFEAVAKEEGLTSVILCAHDMGQTVGLELMARQEENRLPFKIRHAIIYDGSTLVDMINFLPAQAKMLEQPDVTDTEDWDYDEFCAGFFTNTYPAEVQDSEWFKNALACQGNQVFYNNGSRVMTQIMRYIKERQEELKRWERTFFTFQSAPMTLIWGVEDPVAQVAMGDRVKKERPYTDYYRMDGVGHWPIIEIPDFVAETIINRLNQQ
jgi:pimeloyl-ACP methyl ester carboxylesterase